MNLPASAYVRPAQADPARRPPAEHPRHADSDAGAGQALRSWLASPWGGVVLVFGLALLVRLFRLAYHPLWLDEIYGYQLGHLGLLGILRNSLTDPHPPLYYFIQWVASGFGLVHHEIAWRWLSAVSGAATVAIVYHLARLRASWVSAALASALVAVSPMHLFYSQESRSFAFVTMLAAVTMLLLYYLHRSPQRKALWIGHFAVSLVGIYCSYNYVLVIGVQLLYLAAVERRWWPTLRYALLFGLCCAPLVVPFWMTSSSVAAEHTTSRSTNLLEILQALAGGDPARYGFAWAHPLLLAILGVLALVGSVLRPADDSRRFTLYGVLQCVLPFVLFFGIFAPLLGINLILTEAKQFMVLLPAGFVLVAQGTEQLWRINRARIVPAILVGVYGIALLASLSSIQRYWVVPKSPEGLAVLHVREHLQPGDAVVSLHYSPDAALSFYLAETTSYTKPQQHEDRYLFTDVTHIIWSQPVEGQLTPSIPLASIRDHPRIWVLAHASRSQEIVQALAQGCDVGGEWTYRPFQVTLLQDCP